MRSGANFLEAHYPHAQQITAAGLGAAPGFVEAYGVGSYVQIQPHVRLPFEDNAFDIAVSNAVIEHVGSEENQRFFISELKRVARQVFITGPNRFFPVEHHTAIPVLHYWRPTFEAACKALGKTEWLDDVNLILVGLKDFRRLEPKAKTGVTGLRMGPFSSNLFMHIKD